jgi:SNF2 family DNA or RNA helicase
MSRFIFQHAIHDQGVRLTLHELPLIGAERIVTPDRWAEVAGEVAFAGIAHVLGLVEADDGGAFIEGDSIRLSHQALASLTEPRAASLALSHAVPFALSLETDKLITDPAFTVRAGWIEAGNRSVFATRRGAILERGNEHYRIPEPLFSIIEAVDEFRAADTRDDGRRFAALARLQELFPQEERDRLSLDPYIRRFRVLHAAAFSLHLETDGQSFQFDPVLFARRVAERVTTGEETVISEAENLLTPHQQEVFAQQRFPGTDGARDRYAIEGGVYVYLDPALKEALTVVHRMQRADDETRKRFARSPQLYLREALGDKIDDRALESLFIETEQYSERVIDIGLWSPPVLPWIKRDPNDWLPERFGVQIGNKYLTLQAEDLAELRGAVEEAMTRGDSTVQFGEDQIPATQQTIDALSSLIGEVKPSIQPGQPEEASRDDKPQKHVLIVGENFEHLDFTRALAPRISATPAGVPIAVRLALMPHQTSGLAWLQECWTKGYPGVLLADDMGLGKTLQTLAFLAWLRDALRRMTGRRRPKGPFLVVAPTGLLANWIAEHGRHLFDPGLGEMCQAYGRHLSSLKKSGIRDIDSGVPALDHRKMRDADWVLTTYETLRDYHMSFAAIPFACAVFDEMQKVKNPASLNTRASKTVNADFVLGLTGTPIENQLEDLWSIIDIIDPGRLGDLKSFSSTYRPDDTDSLKKLRALLLDTSTDGPAPILRRLKADHLEGLPEKLVHVRRREMPDVQARAYAAAVARAKGEEAGPMLETLHQLRGISLHPVWPQIGAIANPDAYIRQSARLIETFDILDKIAERREKVLIFLESLDMQDQLALMIKNRYKLPKLPMQISGEVPGEKRQKAVDAFQADRGGFDVMILSPKAGGVGLTLTAANHVIHLSRWWNPAVEDQCTDRIYRIGQDETTHVYYPMAIHPEYGEGSFDAVLNGLLENKRDLSRRMLIPPVNIKRDEAWFAERLAQKAATPSRLEEINLEEIDCMEPQAFERWALRRMAALGYVANRTPGTRDAGADGLLIHPQSGSRVIIQCKLKQNTDKPCNDEPIDDLLRARTAYGDGPVRLVTLTNARDFTDKAKHRAQDHAITLIARNELPTWPLGFL